MQADATLVGQSQAEAKIVFTIVCARTGHEMKGRSSALHCSARAIASAVDRPRRHLVQPSASQTQLWRARGLGCITADAIGHGTGQGSSPTGFAVLAPAIALFRLTERCFEMG